MAPFLEVLLRALDGDTEAGSPFPKSVFQHGTVLLYSSDCFAAMGKAQWLHWVTGIPLTEEVLLWLGLLDREASFLCGFATEHNCKCLASTEELATLLVWVRGMCAASSRSLCSGNSNLQQHYMAATSLQRPHAIITADVEEYDQLQLYLLCDQQRKQDCAQSWFAQGSSRLFTFIFIYWMLTAPSTARGHLRLNVAHRIMNSLMQNFPNTGPGCTTTPQPTYC